MVHLVAVERLAQDLALQPVAEAVRGQRDADIDGTGSGGMWRAGAADGGSSWIAIGAEPRPGSRTCSKADDRLNDL